MSDYYNNQGRGGYNGNGRGGYGRGGYGRGDFNGGRGSNLTYAERQALRRITLQQEVERTLMLQRVLANGAQDPATVMALMGTMNGGAGAGNEALMLAAMMQGQVPNGGANQQQTNIQQVADSVRDLTSAVATLRADLTALRTAQIELSPISVRYPMNQQVPNFVPPPVRAAPQQNLNPNLPHPVAPNFQNPVPGGNDRGPANGLEDEPAIPAPADLHVKQLVQDALDAAGNPPSSVEMFKKVNSWSLDDVKAVFGHYMPDEQYSNKGQGVFQLVEFLMKNLNGVGHGLGLW